jgi:hypothetical protein
MLQAPPFLKLKKQLEGSGQVLEHLVIKTATKRGDATETTNATAQAILPKWASG